VNFTGIGNEYSLFLGDLVGGIDYERLLLADLVIGALGVLDDVTVTQAAVVWELALADPQASRSGCSPAPCASAVPLTTAIAALVVRRRQAATTPTTSTPPG
jgi:hypothetical protein